MPARRPAAPAYDEPLALDDVYDEPPVEAWEAGERTPEGPLRVCLACGESPPLGPGCEHPAVATLEHAPDDLVAAARRLAIAARAYRECERALKRLVTREQEAGRAELSSPPPRIARPAAPEASTPPCPRCGFPDTPPATNRPARRPPSKHVSQTLFSFAAASAPTTPPEAQPISPDAPPGAQPTDTPPEAHLLSPDEGREPAPPDTSLSSPSDEPAPPNASLSSPSGEPAPPDASLSSPSDNPFASPATASTTAPAAPLDERSPVVASDAMSIDSSVAAPPSAGEARQKRPKKPRQ